MLDANLQYYIDHQDELVEKHKGKWLVIIEKKVRKAFNSFIEARDHCRNQYKPGTYLIHECQPGKENHTIDLNHKYFWISS